MKLIEMHKSWMDKGELDVNGLCNSLKGTVYEEILELFEPECNPLNTQTDVYWGYSGINVLFAPNEHFVKYQYTPLRQTIVLLICAMHNEL